MLLFRNVIIKLNILWLGEREESSNIHWSPRIGYHYPKIALSVRCKGVGNRLRPAVTPDVIVAHARGAQVWTRGQMCAIARTFNNSRCTSVIAIWINERHIHCYIDVHRFLITITHGPAQFDAKGRKDHVRNHIGVHIQIRLA